MLTFVVEEHHHALARPGAQSYFAWTTNTEGITSNNPPGQSTKQKILLEILDSVFEVLNDDGSLLFGSDSETTSGAQSTGSIMVLGGAPHQ